MPQITFGWEVVLGRVTFFLRPGSNRDSDSESVEVGLGMDEMQRNRNRIPAVCINLGLPEMAI